MNPFPEEDKPLIDFLRQHRSVVPPSPVDLEERIIKAIEANISPEEFAQRDRRSSETSQRGQVWLIPSAIAAGMIATLIGYKTLAPAPQPNPAEAAELEAFIESSWSNTVASDPSADHAYEQLLHGEDSSSSGNGL
jgi:hypothetical protein